MPNGDPMQTLVLHNEWATRKLIEAAAGLTPEKFHQRFDIGPGSVHDTITHTLAAMRVWGDLLAGRERRPRLEGTNRTPETLLALLDEIAADFAASVKTHAYDEVLTHTRGEKKYSFTRAMVITQVLTHGVHHRAQALNMMRHLGVDPAPPSSVIEWSLMVDSPQ